MVETYSLALIAMTAIVLMMIVQSFVATGAQRKLPDSVPGKLPENLGHESFAFRSHRTFMNSLETVPLMLILGLIAIAAGLGSATLAWIMWIYLVARVAHMVLYYAIATEQNPSPRSYFYLLGVLAQVVLIVLTFIALF